MVKLHRYDPDLPTYGGGGDTIMFCFSVCVWRDYNVANHPHVAVTPVSQSVMERSCGHSPPSWAFHFPLKCLQVETQHF